MTTKSTVEQIMQDIPDGELWVCLKCGALAHVRDGCCTCLCHPLNNPDTQEKP